MVALLAARVALVLTIVMAWLLRLLRLLPLALTSHIALLTIVFAGAFLVFHSYLLGTHARASALHRNG